MKATRAKKRESNCIDYRDSKLVTCLDDLWQWYVAERILCNLDIHAANNLGNVLPYCDYLIRVLFNANFAKTRKIALLNTRNNNVFTT